LSFDINNEKFMNLVVKESGMAKGDVIKVVRALNKIEKNAIDSFMQNYSTIVKEDKDAEDDSEPKEGSLSSSVLSDR
jgi:phosphoribosylamine-glycine ligase